MRNIGVVVMRFTATLSGRWKTVDADGAELVLCVGEEQRVVVERCPYALGGGRSVLERIAYTREARLVVARTGQVLGGKTVAGTPPSECTSVEAFTGAGATTEREGGHVTAADFAAFLRPFATGTGQISCSDGLHWERRALGSDDRPWAGVSVRAVRGAARAGLRHPRAGGAGHSHTRA